MKQLPSLSIFFPSLNDARSLPTLIKQADKTARNLSTRYEILIIDDGSTDNTRHITSSLHKRFPHLRTITHPTNKGYGAALKSGFKHAKFDWIFYTDGDGQYDPRELAKLITQASPNIDVVNGYKIHRADHWIRRLIGYIYNRYAHVANRLPISDIDCDFRLIRRSVLSTITLKNDSGAICLELISKLHAKGARFAEVAVHHYPRRFGQSEFFRIRHVYAMFQSLIHRRF